MKDPYNQYYPKQRTGNECKLTKCDRHIDYVEWKMGNRNVIFCMECKHAHISQYKKIQD